MVKFSFISPQLQDRLRAMKKPAYLRIAVCLSSIILDFLVIALAVYGLILVTSWNYVAGLSIISVIVAACICCIQLIYWRKRKLKEHKNDNITQEDLQ